MDHFSQARLFFNSQSEPEKNHMIDALRFELGKVEIPEIRERMVGILAQVDKGLAHEVAVGLRVHVPKGGQQLNKSVPADAEPGSYEPVQKDGLLARSEALSMAGTPKDTIATRKIAFLVADGVNTSGMMVVKEVLEKEGAVVEIIAPYLGYVVAEDDSQVAVKRSFLTAASVFYDAVYIPGGVNSVATLAAEANAVHFINEAYKHCKAIAADAAAMQVLQATYFLKKLPSGFNNKDVMMEGVTVQEDPEKLAKQFVAAIKQHRFWEREKPRRVPA